MTTETTTFDWMAYARWTDETALRRVDGKEDPRERAELMEIWAMGLGEEMLEFIAAHHREFMDSYRAALAEPGLDFHSFRARTNGIGREAEIELGDVVWYMGRSYIDSGNERRDDPFRGQDVSLGEVADRVGKVVGCYKKALRKEGREGLNRLSVSEATAVSCCDEGRRYERETGANAQDHPGDCVEVKVVVGRREEFGRLLDLALSTIEAWLVARGSSLGEVCRLNKEKLAKRKVEGTISTQGERYSEMMADKVFSDVPSPKRSG